MENTFGFKAKSRTYWEMFKSTVNSYYLPLLLVVKFLDCALHIIANYWLLTLYSLEGNRVYREDKINFILS